MNKDAILTGNWTSDCRFWDIYIKKDSLWGSVKGFHTYNCIVTYKILCRGDTFDVAGRMVNLESGFWVHVQTLALMYSVNLDMSLDFFRLRFCVCKMKSLVMTFKNTTSSISLILWSSPFHHQSTLSHCMTYVAAFLMVMLSFTVKKLGHITFKWQIMFIISSCLLNMVARNIFEDAIVGLNEFHN